ncbi:MAG: hypothetical protein ACP5HJ_01620 [Candidatus Micrarchaeia archaeon]|jgi:signal peptidase I
MVGSKKRLKKSLKSIKKVSLSNLFFILGFLFILLYVILKIQIFSILVFAFFVLSIYFDVKEGIKKGTRSYIKDLVISILVVLGFWFISAILLGTYSPYDAVASCSMLPELQRGDVVILRKVDITKIAPVISVNSSFLDILFSEAKRQEICVACNQTTCSYNFVPKNSQFFIYSLSERRLVEPSLNITCGECIKIYENNTTQKIPCFKFLTINNKRIFPTKNNSIIVYETSINDTMQGPIIHRALLVLNVSNEYFVLTKGDNNPNIDLQYGVSPKNQKNIVGEVIFRIPLLGYAKLFLFGQFYQPYGCNFIIKNSTTAK